MEGEFLRGGSITATLKDCSTRPIVKDRLIKSRTSMLIRGKPSLSSLDGMGSNVDVVLMKKLILDSQLEKNGLNIFRGCCFEHF